MRAISRLLDIRPITQHLVVDLEAHGQRAVAIPPEAQVFVELHGASIADKTSQHNFSHLQAVAYLQHRSHELPS